MNYKGNYTYYLEQKEAGNVAADSESVTTAPVASQNDTTSSREDWTKSREEAARQRKRANDLKKTENEISRLEEENDTIKEAMNLPENTSDAGKLMELSLQYEKNEQLLLELYDRWEELSEE